MKPSRRARCRLLEDAGLTLMELLVVIAVIAILASLLLPAIHHVKQKAEGVRCVNNLKQLQLGWQMYADDHRDYMPTNTGGVNAGMTAERPNWVAGQMRYNGDPGDLTESTNTHLLVGEEYADFASIGPYVEDAKVYQCPGDRSTVTINGRSHRRVRSVAMNGYMGGHPLEYEGQYREFRRVAEINDPPPSKAWVLIDEREDSINDGFFVVDVGRQYAIVDYPANSHNGAAGITFADGHVETHAWLEATTQPPLNPGERLPAGSKPTSPDDRDMSWLVSRTTSPVAGSARSQGRGAD